MRYVAHIYYRYDEYLYETYDIERELTEEIVSSWKPVVTRREHPEQYVISDNLTGLETAAQWGVAHPGCQIPHRVGLVLVTWDLEKLRSVLYPKKKDDGRGTL